MTDREFWERMLRHIKGIVKAIEEGPLSSDACVAGTAPQVRVETTPSGDPNIVIKHYRREGEEA